MLFRRHLELQHKDSSGKSLNINREGLDLLKKCYESGVGSYSSRTYQPARYTKKHVEFGIVKKNCLQGGILDDLVDKISTIELWFNDQNVSSKTKVVADGINQPKNDPGSPFRFAHSKVRSFLFNLFLLIH